MRMRAAVLLLLLLLLSACSAFSAFSGPPPTPTLAPTATSDRGPIYGPATLTLRDFIAGRTLYLKPDDRFDLDDAVPDAVQIDDPAIVAADASTPRRYHALKAGTTALKLTYNLCQGITSGTCGDPSLLLKLTVVVEDGTPPAEASS